MKGGASKVLGIQPEGLHSKYITCFMLHLRLLSSPNYSINNVNSLFKMYLFFLRYHFTKDLANVYNEFPLNSSFAQGRNLLRLM